MKFLVASMRHELLPLAHRLRREGHEVQTLVWRAKYEGAWGGSIEKIARHSDRTLNHEALAPQVKAARDGDLVVVTTVRRVAELFHEAKSLFPMQEHLTKAPPRDRLLLGGWFDGETVQTPHLLVADWGAWTGGQGPSVMGGLTLIRGQEALPPVVKGALDAVLDRMKSVSFRGLFHFDVEEEPATGELRLHGLSAGWPFLHTQAFLAECTNFGEALQGKPPLLGHRYVCVLPITVPPWPHEDHRGTERVGMAVEGLTPAQQGRTFFFDITVNAQARKLQTAGLDGLLAVATGASDSTPSLARARALEIGQRMQVPEKQHRTDAGMAVDAVLATLEDRWNFTI